jgi:hypothetical protein
MKQTTIRLREDQREYIDQVDLEFSTWLRDKLDERMKDDGFEVDK